MITRWVFWLVQLFAFAELLITTYIQLAVTVWQIRNLYIWKLKALWVHGHWELFDTFIESHERISNSISFTKHIKCIKFCFAQPGYFDSFFTRGSVSLSHWFSIYFLWYWLFGAESAGRRKGFRFFPDRLRRMSHYLPHWELSRSSVILANRNPPNVVCLDRVFAGEAAALKGTPITVASLRLHRWLFLAACSVLYFAQKKSSKEAPDLGSSLVKTCSKVCACVKQCEQSTALHWLGVSGFADKGEMLRLVAACFD